jgi:hypothetical protein
VDKYKNGGKIQKRRENTKKAGKHGEKIKMAGKYKNGWEKYKKAR